MSAVSLALCMSAAAGTPAFACACCSSEGQRYVETDKIDTFARGILDELRFASAAHLFTGEADVESIEGIRARSADFQLAVTKGAKSWEFDFTQEGGRGTLTLALPASVTRFEVDPREPRSTAPGTGPALYKEWRLAVAPRGTGAFAGISGDAQKATLILQGRGNSCTDAGQFNAWSLVLHGPKGTVTLFGDLTPP